MTFRALVLDQSDDAQTLELRELDDTALPEGDVTVNVEWSSLNYKDGMILRGIGRLVRTFPHVPGVDLAGTVESSDSDRFAPGDRVVLTGFRVGEAWWGGYAQQARVKSEWLVKVPDSLTTRQTMEIGTAGLTAMLCVDALERDGLHPDAGPVLCTGAAGGVGSYAVHLLGALGYAVTASTGRPETADYLRAIGATEVIDRAGDRGRPGEAAALRAVGRERRCSRRADPRPRPRGDALRLGRSRVRQHRRQRPPDLGAAVHPPQRPAARH